MRSYLPDYELFGPLELEQALQILAAGDGWQPIAGGTDLMVLLNAGKLPFRRLMSVQRLDELKQIRASPTNVIIGAAVTYSQIRQHAILQSEFPLLCQAASWTGGIANQNQGTIGGNIANASPAADSSPPLLVHDAEIRLVSIQGRRTVPYKDFHLEYKKLAMRPDELIYSIELPRRKTTEWRYHGRKAGTRRAQAISKTSFAGAAQIDGKKIAQIRLALGSVAPVPLRCAATEDFLMQSPLSMSTIAEARRILASEIAPIDDIRSTAAYRFCVSENLLAEFLETLR